jgi:hypothetical protein
VIEPTAGIGTVTRHDDSGVPSSGGRLPAGLEFQRRRARQVLAAILEEKVALW